MPIEVRHGDPRLLPDLARSTGKAEGTLRRNEAQWGVDQQRAAAEADRAFRAEQQARSETGAYGRLAAQLAARQEEAEASREFETERVEQAFQEKLALRDDMVRRGEAQYTLEDKQFLARIARGQAQINKMEADGQITGEQAAQMRQELNAKEVGVSPTKPPVTEADAQTPQEEYKTRIVPNPDGSPSEIYIDSAGNPQWTPEAEARITKEQADAKALSDLKGKRAELLVKRYDTEIGRLPLGRPVSPEQKDAAWDAARGFVDKVMPLPAEAAPGTVDPGVADPGVASPGGGAPGTPQGGTGATPAPPTTTMSAADMQAEMVQRAQNGNAVAVQVCQAQGWRY